MIRTQEKPKEYLYKAFISYTNRKPQKESYFVRLWHRFKSPGYHHAEHLAMTLKSFQLDNYQELSKKYNREIPQKLGSIFFAPIDLKDKLVKLEDIVQNSEYLIVLCSPEASKAPWVDKELTYFRKGKTEDEFIDKLIPYAISGIPYDTDTNKNCCPSTLMELKEKSVEKEAYFINLKDTHDENDAEGKILAKLYELDKVDDVRDYHKRKIQKQNKRKWLIISVISIILLCLGFLWYTEQEKNRIHESLSLVTQSKQALSDHNGIAALILAMKAYEKSPGLAETRLNLQRLDGLRDDILLYFKSDEGMGIGPNEEIIISNDGYVRFYDPISFNLRKEVFIGEKTDLLVFSPNKEYFAIAGLQHIFIFHTATQTLKKQIRRPNGVIFDVFMSNQYNYEQGQNMYLNNNGAVIIPFSDDILFSDNILYELESTESSAKHIKSPIHANNFSYFRNNFFCNVINRDSTSIIDVFQNSIIKILPGSIIGHKNDSLILFHEKDSLLYWTSLNNLLWKDTISQQKYEHIQFDEINSQYIAFNKGKINIYSEGGNLKYEIKQPDVTYAKQLNDTLFSFIDTQQQLTIYNLRKKQQEQHYLLPSNNSEVFNSFLTLYISYRYKQLRLQQRGVTNHRILVLEKDNLSSLESLLYDPNLLASRFTPDGKKCLTINSNNTLSCWDVEADSIISQHKMKGSLFVPCNPILSPGGKVYYLTSPDTQSWGSLDVFYDMLTHKIIGEPRKNMGAFIYLSDSLIITQDNNTRNVYLEHLYSGEKNLLYTKMPQSINDRFTSSYNADSSIVAFNIDSHPFTIELNNDRIHKLPEINGGIRQITINPQGTKIIINGSWSDKEQYKSQVYYMDALTGNLLQKWELDYFSINATFSDDGLYGFFPPSFNGSMLKFSCYSPDKDSYFPDKGIGRFRDMYYSRAHNELIIPNFADEIYRFDMSSGDIKPIYKLTGSSIQYCHEGDYLFCQEGIIYDLNQNEITYDFSTRFKQVRENSPNFYMYGGREFKFNSGDYISIQRLTREFIIVENNNRQFLFLLEPSEKIAKRTQERIKMYQLTEQEKNRYSRI